jgi:hypothetical protein
MPQGQQFITHEFDEAIAIQEAIVAAGEQLAKSHPFPEAKELLKRGLKEDQKHLRELKQFGRKFGATGKREEIAEAMESLALETARKAGTEESEAYEATAVLINLKRKQQDSAGSIVKIARQSKNAELRDAASAMQKATKKSADGLAKSLTNFAVQIAGR